MPRLFFGLEIPPDTVQALLKVESPIDGARWQRAEQLHLTLAFLGEVPAEHIALATHTARALRIEPFTLQVKGLGCFGNPEKPRALWAGVDQEAPVARLHEQLATSLDEQGFTIKNQPFKPHITLSRFKRGHAGSVEALLDAYRDAMFGTLPVTSFALFQSTPGPQGSVYTVLERFSLPG